jgi:hypothetical protein
MMSDFPVQIHAPSRTLQTSIGEVSVASTGANGNPTIGMLKVSTFATLLHDGVSYVLLHAHMPTSVSLVHGVPQVKCGTCELVLCEIVSMDPFEHREVGKGSPEECRLFKGDLKCELKKALTAMAEADPLWVQDGVVACCQNLLGLAEWLRDGTEEWVASGCPTLETVYAAEAATGAAPSPATG